MTDKTNPSLSREDGPPERSDVGMMHAPIMREKQEPRDGMEPVPVWLVAIFGAIIFWGGWYLAMYSGGFRADVLDTDPAARFEGAAGPAAPPDPMVLGERLYKANCVSCHQAMGQGVPGQYPPLAGSEWVVGSPGVVKRILLQGLEGPIVVKGNTYNGNMPPFARLKDEQLAALATYIRASWGNTAPPITTEDVATARSETATRTTPWRAEDLAPLK